jgi:hypothetical protein
MLIIQIAVIPVEKFYFPFLNPLSFVLLHHIWIMHAKIFNVIASKIESRYVALLNIKKINI